MEESLKVNISQYNKSGLSLIFKLIVSISEKILNNINMVEWKYAE